MATEKELREQVLGRLISMKKCAEIINVEPARIGPLIYDLGVLHAHLSEIAEISSQRLESQTQQLIIVGEHQIESARALEGHTRQLIRLQWALIWLTVGLLIFTICLAIRH